MSVCPHCNAPIHDKQVVCLKCGSQIRPLQLAQTPNSTQKRRWWIWLIIISFFAVMAVVMFIFPMFGQG